ncbi:clpC [Symbiodinium sp. CCMP2592]|nr:clpC [Symbiodinium sp. CCMP2592]
MQADPAALYAFARLAVHTGTQLLHPAALLEFRARLRELVEAGQSYEAALLWGSVLEVQHYPPPPRGLLEGLPPGVPPIRTVPCVEVGCARCREGRGGFRFPFVGTYARRSIVVSAATSPARAWEGYHQGGDERLSFANVFEMGSGLWPTDMLPDHANRLVQPVGEEAHPRGATPGQLWLLWRDWQQGELIWREPAYYPIPTWAEGRSDRRARAHRALWLLLGAIEAGLAVLPFSSAIVAESQHALTARIPASAAHRLRVFLAASLAGPMSGIYSVQAMEGQAGAVDAPPGTAAETVVDRVAAKKVLAFREMHGLLEDGDFAYAFASWEEAASNAGHAVADAWSEVSQDLQDDALLSLVDRAVAAGAAAAESARPVVRLSKLVKPVGETAPRKRRQSAAQVSGPDAGELADFMVLAANKVASSEHATVTRALKTLRELSQWQQLRGRAAGLGDIDSIDLFAFLREGTPAPARALSGLRWFTKMANLPWELGGVQPAPTLGREGPAQAAVAEPGMLEELEHRVAQMYDQSDPRWTCLLADWLIASGCVRHKHLARSFPVCVTQSTAHFFCSRGKQAHSRAGFRWAAPSHFSCGFAWAEAWVEFYGSLPAAARKRCGICFDAAGRPWELRQVTLLTQEIFSGLEPPVTTYSWRRVAPSVGSLLQLDELSLLALGDWADRGKIRETGASMPLHYSGTKYAMSVRVKHLVWSAASRCLTYDTWSEVPPSMLQREESSLQAEVAEKIRLDSTVIWKAPAGTPGPEAKLAFKTTALKLRRQSRATTAGETRPRPAEPGMPPQVNGRVCSAFLRNGKRLCPAFQSGSCRADSCSLSHLCATVLRSGRVCGGRHPARDCHDRRRIHPEDVPPAISAPQESPAGVTRPALPRSRPPPLPLAAASSQPSSELVEIESARDISHAEVLADASASNARVRASLRPGRDDAFLLEQSLRDAESGFCSEPLPVGGVPFRLIPRCVITQSSGKQRIIDNADTGGQSELSSDPNKLVLCSPLRPAQHAAALLACLDEPSRQRAAAEDALEGRGEDWPEAYRHCPMDGASSRCCVVVWWHQDWGEPAYQLYTGLLFGLPLAVTSFNRYSRAAEALGRRLLAILVSMYFDDAHLTDWASSKGSAQSSFAGLNTCLGSPFAPAKRQPMALTGTFLGLNFDFEGCLHSGLVRFFVRDRLVSKVHDMLDQALASSSLSPGLAAKIYGTCNFLEQGMYGRVGAGGLRAIRERSDEGGRELTPPILACFSLIRAVLAVRPEREFEVLPQPVARFCAASDAAEDIPGAGSGGFHLVWLDATELRESFIAHIGPEVYAQFSPGEHKIAQLELAMVLYALAVRAPSFRGRRGYWYIDNVAALMSLIRGRSSSPDLECLAQLIHIAMFALRTSFFFEYIPSKTNWADAVSRVGFADPWLHQRGFSCHIASFPFQLVGLPFLAVLRVFEFL